MQVKGLQELELEVGDTFGLSRADVKQFSIGKRSQNRASFGTNVNELTEASAMRPRGEENLRTIKVVNSKGKIVDITGISLFFSFFSFCFNFSKYFAYTMVCPVKK